MENLISGVKCEKWCVWIERGLIKSTRNWEEDEKMGERGKRVIYTLFPPTINRIQIISFN